jgi:hypothetical protein
MSKLKAALIWAIIVIQIAIMLAGFFVLGYSLFTKTPIRDLVDFDWWIGLFVFYLWVAKFSDVKKLSKVSE